jgi:hypothetical protein
VLERVYKAKHFVLEAQSLDKSPLSLCRHNKMLFPVELPQCPLSVQESHNISGGSFGTQRPFFFSPPLSLGVLPRLLGKVILLGACQWAVWSGGETHPPSELGWGPQSHNGTWRGTGTSEGSATHQTGKNPGSKTRPEWQKGSLITSQRHPSNFEQKPNHDY